MPASERHTILGEIVSHFEVLAERLEHAIETFADDDSGSVDLSALHRARDIAIKGANITRNASSDVRRPFD